MMLRSFLPLFRRQVVLSLRLSVVLVSILAAAAQMQPDSASQIHASPSNASLPAANALAVGKVLDPILCAADPSETYALYLPTTYTSTKMWPIIYVFDPEGRGIISVALYKDIVDKFGFILAASNNSRNFQTDAASRAAHALWNDTHARLSLDPRRVYTMGFSGGARVATAIAIRCEHCAIAGVISHGAGYPFPPSGTERFAYFAFIGNQDFNWPEIMELRRQKEESSSPYRLRVFPGDHEWAPAAIFAEALRWLELKAMQAGAIPPDASFIDQQFARTEKEAEEAQTRKDAITEFDAYCSLVSDFSGLKDVSGFQPKLTALKSSPEFKEGLKKQQDAIDQQRALSQQLSSDISSVADATLDSQLALRTAIVDGMKSLKRHADHAKTDDEHLILTRAFNALWVQGIEAGQAELENGRHFAQAEFYFQLMGSVTPDALWPHLLLAETAVARGDKKRANKELREAVKRGLKNPDTIAKDVNLQSLHDDPEFQQLVAELKAKRDSQSPR